MRLRNQLSDLSILNDVLDRFGQRGALPQATLSELRIVCDEIIGNVIAYAYPHGGEHEIDVRLQMISVMEVSGFSSLLRLYDTETERLKAFA